jgi:hypothetical protein
MFYLHTNEYIYLTCFNEDIICLNLSTNEYIIISGNLAHNLSIAIEYPVDFVEGRYISHSKLDVNETFSESIDFLKKLGVLSIKNHKEIGKTKLVRDQKFLGATNLDWRLSNDFFNKKCSIFLVLEAYFWLSIVHLIIKLLGFYSLIKFIKNKKTSLVKNKIDRYNIESLSSALDKACFYFPIKTKCLEWAATLAIMCINRKLMCNLEIGVQNMPFAAHAWVKLDGEVISDSQNLPDSLAIILSEPF